MKGSKDIERTTQWAEKSGLTLTFEHVTWKSIGIIYWLGATLHQVWYILIKWRGQKILRGQHLVYRQTDRQLQNNMPFFKGDEDTKCVFVWVYFFNKKPIRYPIGIGILNYVSDIRVQCEQICAKFTKFIAETCI